MKSNMTTEMRAFIINECSKGRVISKNSPYFEEAVKEIIFDCKNNRTGKVVVLVENKLVSFSIVNEKLIAEYL